MGCTGSRLARPREADCGREGASPRFQWARPYSRKASILLALLQWGSKFDASPRQCEVRNVWQFFRDRRPETYGWLTDL